MRVLRSVCPLVALVLPTIAGTPLATAQPVSERHEELKHKADDAYRARDFATAISLASQVLSENSNDPVALYLSASAKVEQGIAAGDADQIRSGIEDARSAIRLDPQKKPDYYLPYFYGMTHLSRIERNPAHAETVNTTATNLLRQPGIEPQVRANVIYQRGLARQQLQRVEEAVEDFRRALELAPTHLAARMALCSALAATDDLQAAEDAYKTAVETFPSSPLVFNNRGMFYQNLGRNEQAILDFSHAISLDQNYVQAYLNRGFTFIQTADYEAAIGDFNSALDRQPENASAFSLRGTAKLRSGDIQGSIVDYTRAVELDPANPTARADLGFAYFFAGDYETAAAGFDQSLTLEPDNQFLEPWRYTALVRSGRQAKAKESYASLRDKPVEQQSWFDALTLLLMGELTEEQIIGRLESRDARLKDAQICEAYYFIGVTKLEKDPQEAAQYFRRALRSQAKQLSAYQAAQIAVERTGTSR